jgi:membrane protease YdiL (CAAX protease family)
MLATLSIATLALYLLIGEPLLGRHAHRRLLAALDAGTPGARQRFYRQWTWQGWALLLVALAVTLGMAGWTPVQLGLCLPHWPPGWSSPGSANGMLAGFVAGVALAALGGVAIGLAMARRRRDAPPARTPRVAGGDRLLRMLPRTRAERRSFAALALTAGITEEVIWRGFGLGLLFALLPRAPVAVPIALAALAFGWAHLYQGWTGILATALLGGLFAWLYWATGSLLPPMLLHVLVDLRAALVRVPADAPPAAGAPTP